MKLPVDGEKCKITAMIIYVFMFFPQFNNMIFHIFVCIGAILEQEVGSSKDIENKL